MEDDELIDEDFQQFKERKRSIKKSGFGSLTGAEDSVYGEFNINSQKSRHPLFKQRYKK